MARKSIWDDDYAPYGKADHPGNPDEWRGAFRDAWEARMGEGEADEVLGHEDPWKILGVVKGATIENVKRAFRKLAVQWHPDRNDNSDESVIKFRRILAAYSKLCPK